MRTLTILCLSLASSLGVVSQEVDSSRKAPGEADRCAFSEVYRSEGWKVPGLSMAAAGERATLTTSPGGPVKGVFVTRMTIKPGANSISHWLLPECPAEPAGRLVLSDILVKPLEMWKLDYEGNVFAYKATYELQLVEKGTPQGTLRAYFVVFIDVDGTGKFKVMRWDLPVKKSFLFAPEVPAWAKAQHR